MPYYLRHHFDPDFNHKKLKPREREDGSVDHYNMGYVQNVVHGQVVAELIEIDPGESPPEERFLQDEMKFPIGTGTIVNPDDPNQLIADANGYVFYEEGVIKVKTLLNVRGDVDFNTGNIPFVGDIVVHGSVRSGFSIRANDIRIKELAEAAQIKAMGSINCMGGIKGGNTGLIDAGGTVKAAYCENATIRAGRNVLIEGACMHNVIFAGNKLAVKGRLTGGDIYCLEYAYIEEQLGGGLNAPTQILAGYDPMLLFQDVQITKQIRKLRENIEYYKGHIEKSEELREEFEPALKLANRQLELQLRRKSRVWEKIYTTENLEECRIIVPGKVKPGVEISIGSAYLKVDDFLEDVHFYYKDREVCVGSPAIAK